jgi:hypothetical protein
MILFLEAAASPVLPYGKRAAAIEGYLQVSAAESGWYPGKVNTVVHPMLSV